MDILSWQVSISQIIVQGHTSLQPLKTWLIPEARVLLSKLQATQYVKKETVDSITNYWSSEVWLKLLGKIM